MVKLTLLKDRNVPVFGLGAGDMITASICEHLLPDTYFIKHLK